MPKKLNDIVHWAFGLIVIGAIGMLISILTTISTSIEGLNMKVAVVLEKVATHERTLDRQDSRIDRIEKKIFK